MPCSRATKAGHACILGPQWQPERMTSSASPFLRALVENGDTYDDPSEDLLFMLLEDVEAGEGLWVLVERIEDATGQTFAQCVRLTDGSYQIEHRDGAADRHFVTAAAGFRDAHTFLTAWSFDLPGWRELSWRPLVA